MTYGAFRFALIARIMDDGLTPVQVSDALWERASDFPQVRDEAALLDLAGSSWDVAQQLQARRPMVAAHAIDADSSAF